MKKVLMVLAPLFFLIAVFTFTDSFALFESSKTYTTGEDVASWTVKVNDDILSGSSDEFTVDNVTWIAQTNVKPGKVAPGMSGYFDITIDPNGTDTSIIYDVTFDFSNLDSDQFTIDSIEEIDNKGIVQTDAFTYSNIITLSEIEDEETNTIRVYLTWVNNEANNVKDTELGEVFGNTIEIPVEVVITQYMDGDTLTQYVPPQPDPDPDPEPDPTQEPDPDPDPGNNGG